MLINERIKTLRLRLKLTQEELAEKLKVGQSTVSESIAEYSSNIKDKYIEALEKIYKLKDENSELRAKLTKVYQISITRGGKLITEDKMKHELIQTHTARRSFATNLFLAGYPPVEIMKITGHKTEVEFLKYIRITSEEVAFKMAKDPRFADRKS